MWVDPVPIADLLDTFHLDHLENIAWIDPQPSRDWFQTQLTSVIRDILLGGPNSLHPHGEPQDPGSSPG